MVALRGAWIRRSSWSQGCADALSLLALSSATDDKSSTSAALAVAGGMTVPYLVVVALPSLLAGAAGSVSVVIVLAHLCALAVRVWNLRDDERKLDQADQPISALAAAFLFVPESLYRAASMRDVEGGGGGGGGSESSGKPSGSGKSGGGKGSKAANKADDGGGGGGGGSAGVVEVWSSGSSSLCIGGVPPLALVRRFALEQAAPPAPSSTAAAATVAGVGVTHTLVINLCSWWAGTNPPPPPPTNPSHPMIPSPFSLLLTLLTLTLSPTPFTEGRARGDLLLAGYRAAALPVRSLGCA